MAITMIANPRATPISASLIIGRAIMLPFLSENAILRAMISSKFKMNGFIYKFVVKYICFPALMNIASKILCSIFTCCLILADISCIHGTSNHVISEKITADEIIVGSESIAEYLPVIKNKRIAIVANQTSLVDQKHLVDTLQRMGVNIKLVFAPEHGFRGEESAGEKISDGKDAKSGLAVVSLYGKHLKPTKSELKDIDIVLFDIQDVGARFYTYISTLQYVMEACAESNVLLIILDRPNPNGFYVDGPVLQDPYRSFVGMMKIPVVHGMTVGEYASMLVGERWIRGAEALRMQIVKVKNYTHSKLYNLPVRPSPNLPNMKAVYLYPSLCFFEGTAVSIGRGTDFPFQCFGFPGMKNADISIIPVNIKGVAKNPPYQDTLCNLKDLRHNLDPLTQHQIQLQWLLDAYSAFPEKKDFFNSFFDKLAGSSELRRQITSGESEENIRKSWEPALSEFKLLRKKYLLYTDFAPE